MTDTKFDELVNAYLDNEITPEEHEALKAAINVDPARQKAFYQMYKFYQVERMLLAKDPFAIDEGGIPPEPQVRDRFSAFYYLGLTAACLALTAFVFFQKKLEFVQEETAIAELPLNAKPNNNVATVYRLPPDLFQYTDDSGAGGNSFRTVHFGNEMESSEQRVFVVRFDKNWNELDEPVEALNPEAVHPLPLGSEDPQLNQLGNDGNNRFGDFRTQLSNARYLK